MVLARGAAQTAKKAPAHTRRCKCDRQAGSSGSRSGPLLGSRHNTQGQPRRRSCRATPFLPSKSSNVPGAHRSKSKPLVAKRWRGKTRRSALALSLIRERGPVGRGRSGAHDRGAGTVARRTGGASEGSERGLGEGSLRL